MKSSLPIKHSWLAATLLLASINLAHATIVEPFTGGQLSTPGWSTGIGADASIYLSTAAPDGSFGIALSEGVWSYNNNIHFTAGETLSAWINPGPSPDANNFAQGGRIYLGFDAGVAGAFSFVAASDTNQLGFQDNTGYGTPAFANSVAQSFLDQWYLLTIALSTDGSQATASLYDTDGTTLLSTLKETGLSSTDTGIALRGIGGAAVTSISIVPEAPAVLMFSVGLGLLGAMRRSIAKAA